MQRLNAYDRRLEKLKQDLIKMGTTVQFRLEEAMAALILQDAERAKYIAESDDLVDDMDHALESQTLWLMLLQQPREEDLRVFSSTLRLTRELERIGDYAVDIAEIALVLSDSGDYFKPLEDIGKMGQKASSMLQDSLRAYVNSDLALATDVFRRDKMVDDLFNSLFDELMGYMKKEPRYVDQASYLSLVARHLERIGDHAVNVAEMVCYLKTGERRFFRDLGRTSNLHPMASCGEEKPECCGSYQAEWNRVLPGEKR
ncbi:MAG: phosphate signaling complex protein PhoU [Bacillota bacterium]|jgi:phosphate transport system protein